MLQFTVRIEGNSYKSTTLHLLANDGGGVSPISYPRNYNHLNLLVGSFYVFFVSQNQR